MKLITLLGSILFLFFIFEVKSNLSNESSVKSTSGAKEVSSNNYLWTVTAGR